METLTPDSLREELDRFAQIAFQKELTNYSEAVLSAVKKGLREELPPILQEFGTPRRHIPASNRFSRGVPMSKRFPSCVSKRSDGGNSRDWAKRHMRGYVACNEIDEELFWVNFRKEKSSDAKRGANKRSTAPAHEIPPIHVPSLSGSDEVRQRSVAPSIISTGKRSLAPSIISTGKRSVDHCTVSAPAVHFSTDADGLKKKETRPEYSLIIPEAAATSQTPLDTFRSEPVRHQEHLDNTVVMPFEEGVPPTCPDRRDVHTPQAKPCILNGIDNTEKIQDAFVEESDAGAMKSAGVSGELEGHGESKTVKPANEKVLNLMTRDITTGLSRLFSYDGRDRDEKAFSERVRWNMHTVVHSAYFDYVIGLFILLNGVCMGLQTDYVARFHPPQVPTGYRIIDIVFCCVFVIELCLRLFCDRWAFYWSPEWRWNMFDTVIVGLQVVEEILMAIFNTVTKNDGAMPLNFSFLRVLRILRLVKIVRLVRVLRLISELRTLVMSILGSMKSLAWTVLLLFLMIYSVAVYLTQMVAEVDERTSPQLLIRYGNLPFSTLTLFQSITGGLDWNDALKPLVDDIGVGMTFVFVIYIAFSVLAILNVVTGVFVESALLSAKKDQDIYMVNNMRDFFKRVKGPTGLSCDDFLSQIKLPQMMDYFRAIDVDPSEASSVFQLIDLNNDGCVDIDEFVSGCTRLRGPAKALDLAVLIFEVRRVMEDVVQIREDMEGGIFRDSSIFGESTDVGTDQSSVESTPAKMTGAVRSGASKRTSQESIQRVTHVEQPDQVEVTPVRPLSSESEENSSGDEAVDVEALAARPSGRWFQKSKSCLSLKG